MWLEGLELVLKRLILAGCPVGKICAISGSGQQHGSVYWAQGASVTLSQLDPAVPLGRLLGYAFARTDSPIWADSSTGSYCRSLEAAVGGAAFLSKMTGSRAYERFTGNQIFKCAKERSGDFRACERISLVSSFMCSLFLGKYAPIDTADGSGTNLNNIQSKEGREWFDTAVTTCSGDMGHDCLVAKLGDAMVPAHTVLGRISSYFVHRFGFSSACSVIAWSGDNPCSLAGLGLHTVGDVAISLGTSDTMFAMMSHVTPGKDGHVLRNPMDPESFMAMLCFKNGSLAREDVAKRVCGGDWSTFGGMLGHTKAGNEGNIGFYYLHPEITPTTGDVSGIWRFDRSGQEVDKFTPAVEVRAIIESKFLAMRLFAEGIGMEPKTVQRIVATGGASSNRSILQVASDVFGVPVYTLAQSDSASFGAALRACHAHRCGESGVFVPFSAVVSPSAFSYEQVASPDPSASQIYTHMVSRYSTVQSALLEKLRSST